MAINSEWSSSTCPHGLRPCTAGELDVLLSLVVRPQACGLGVHLLTAILSLSRFNGHAFYIGFGGRITAVERDKMKS